MITYQKKKKKSSPLKDPFFLKYINLDCLGFGLLLLFLSNSNMLIEGQSITFWGPSSSSCSTKVPLTPYQPKSNESMNSHYIIHGSIFFSFTVYDLCLWYVLLFPLQILAQIAFVMLMLMTHSFANRRWRWWG